MKNIIFEKEYPVNSINMNINKRLGLFGTLGILQDIATIHAEDLGFGYKNMIRDNSFWVVTQQKLKMNFWPSWQEIVKVKTWPRSIEGMKANRDFEIFIGDSKIGECVSTFMVIDGINRKPIRPNLGSEIENNLPKNILEFTPEKIIIPKDLKLKNTIEVRNSDLDMNNHVNNTKYSQWILDTIPLQYHRNIKLLEFDINFISEAYLSDRIDILSTENQSNDDQFLEHYYQGIRQSDGKLIFAAKIKAQEI